MSGLNLSPCCFQLCLAFLILFQTGEIFLFAFSEFFVAFLKFPFTGAELFPALFQFLFTVFQLDGSIGKLFFRICDFPLCLCNLGLEFQAAILQLFPAVVQLLTGIHQFLPAFGELFIRFFLAVIQFLLGICQRFLRFSKDICIPDLTALLGDGFDLLHILFR